MTRGVLIFAFNNEHTDYVRMAAWSAERIRRHLDLPVAVVTDSREQASLYPAFDKIITAPAATGGTRYFEDYQKTVSWHNAGRTDAYSLTPWDETLVLDADYVVCSSTLNTLWESNAEFLCHRLAWNAADGQELTELNQFGRLKMPMWWATVMMFRKSNHAQYIFDCMEMVKTNWQHYRDLYQIDRPTYRNDFALSIALGIVSGQTWRVQEIPWDLTSVLPDTKLEQLKDDYFSLTTTDSKNISRVVGISGTDFHAMGKQHLEKIIDAS